MASTPVFYGSFNLNDNVNYFVLEKPLSIVSIKESLLKIARVDGMKKTGSVVNERHLTLKVRVVGSSRANLESLLDALYGALIVPQQHLQMHAVDNRYYICDCIGAQATLVPGKVVACDVALVFLAQLPYAYAPSASSYTTTITSWSLSGGVYTATFNVTGGGNVYSWPTFTLTSQNSVSWTGMSLTQTTDNQYFEVDSSLPAHTNDYLTINCDYTTQSGYTVTLNGGSPLSFVGQFPVLEPTSTGFSLAIHASASPSIQMQVAWTARWLS